MGQELSRHRRTNGETEAADSSSSPQRETEAAEEACPVTGVSPGDVFLSETTSDAKTTGPSSGGKTGRGFSSPEDSLSPERPVPQNGQRRSSLQRWMLAAARVREGSFTKEASDGDARKLSMETSWDKWDPELTVKMIRVPSVQNYGKIRRVLQLADR